MIRFGTQMHDFIIFFFAMGAGTTASGLAANIYRLVGGEPRNKLTTFIHYAVMVVAGPVVLAGNSTQSFREKQCSKGAYALALALSGYWSFAMGLMILSIFVSLRGA
ncbi:MAG TPA: hypothetical protein VFI23_00160 [Rhizomicrobium sp.]|nr:hypothetical protein [Rhizomicrobium sp.]